MAAPRPCQKTFLFKDPPCPTCRPALASVGLRVTPWDYLGPRVAPWVPIVAYWAHWCSVWHLGHLGSLCGQRGLCGHDGIGWGSLGPLRSRQRQCGTDGQSTGLCILGGARANPTQSKSVVWSGWIHVRGEPTTASIYVWPPMWEYTPTKRNVKTKS